MENEAEKPENKTKKEDNLGEEYTASDKVNLEEDKKAHPLSEFERTLEVENVKEPIQGNDGTTEGDIIFGSPSVAKAVVEESNSSMDIHESVITPSKLDEQMSAISVDLREKAEDQELEINSSEKTFSDGHRQNDKEAATSLDKDEGHMEPEQSSVGSSKTISTQIVHNLNNTANSAEHLGDTTKSEVCHEPDNREHTPATDMEGDSCKTRSEGKENEANMSSNVDSQNMDPEVTISLNDEDEIVEREKLLSGFTDNACAGTKNPSEENESTQEKNNIEKKITATPLTTQLREEINSEEAGLIGMEAERIKSSSDTNDDSSICISSQTECQTGENEKRETGYGEAVSNLRVNPFATVIGEETRSDHAESAMSGTDGDSSINVYVGGHQEPFQLSETMINTSSKDFDIQGEDKLVSSFPAEREDTFFKQGMSSASLRDVSGTVSKNDINVSENEEENQIKMFEKADIIDSISTASDTGKNHNKKVDDSLIECAKNKQIENDEENKQRENEWLALGEGSGVKCRDEKGSTVAYEAIVVAEAQLTAEMLKDNKSNDSLLENEGEINLAELLHATYKETENSSLGELGETASTDKLVTATGSEEILGDPNKKGDTDDIKDENISAELNDKTDTEILCNANNNCADYPAVEEKPEEGNRDDIEAHIEEAKHIQNANEASRTLQTTILGQTPAERTSTNLMPDRPIGINEPINIHQLGSQVISEADDAGKSDKDDIEQKDEASFTEEQKFAPKSANDENIVTDYDLSNKNIDSTFTEGETDRINRQEAQTRQETSGRTESEVNTNDSQGTEYEVYEHQEVAKKADENETRVEEKEEDLMGNHAELFVEETMRSHEEAETENQELKGINAGDGKRNTVLGKEESINKHLTSTKEEIDANDSEEGKVVSEIPNQETFQQATLITEEAIIKDEHGAGDSIPLPLEEMTVEGSTEKVLLVENSDSQDTAEQLKKDKGSSNHDFEFQGNFGEDQTSQGCNSPVGEAIVVETLKQNDKDAVESKEEDLNSVQSDKDQSPLSPSIAEEGGENINCQYKESRNEIDRQEIADSTEEREVVKEEEEEYLTAAQTTAQEADKNLLSAYLHESAEPIQETQLLNSEQGASPTTESLEEEMMKGTNLEAAEVDGLNLVNVSGLSEQSKAMAPDQADMGRINVDRLEYETTETVGKESWSNTEHTSRDQGLANLHQPETDAETESNKDMDEISEAKVTDEHLENSIEEAKEQRADEFVLEPKIVPTPEQISDPPSVSNRLEVGTAEESQEKDKLMLENSNMDEQYSTNEEHRDGEFVEVEPGEERIAGQTDPPQIEVKKGFEKETQAPQDKETLILEKSNVEKEDSTILIGQIFPQVVAREMYSETSEHEGEKSDRVSNSVLGVNETEMLLREREPKIIEDKLDTIGAGTETFQTITENSSVQALKSVQPGKEHSPDSPSVTDEGGESINCAYTETRKEITRQEFVGSMEEREVVKEKCLTAEQDTERSNASNNKDADKNLQSAYLNEFTESIQETQNLNSEEGASLTTESLEEEMKKGTNLEAAEVDSLNVVNVTGLLEQYEEMIPGQIDMGGINVDRLECDTTKTVGQEFWSDTGYMSRDQGLNNLRQPETEAETENFDQSSESKVIDEHLEISCQEAKEQSAAEFVVEQAKFPTAEQISDPPSINNRFKVGTAEESQDKLEKSTIYEEASTNKEHRDGDCVEVEPGEEHSARQISQVEILNPVNVSGLSEQSEVMTPNQGVDRQEYDTTETVGNKSLSVIGYKSRDQGLNNLHQLQTVAETECNRNLDQTPEEKVIDEHFEISCEEAKEQSATEFVVEQAKVPTAEQISDPPSINNRLKVGTADESQDMDKLKLENSNINEEASTNEEQRDGECVEVEPGEEHTARQISEVDSVNLVNVTGLSEQSEVMTADQVDMGGINVDRLECDTTETVGNESLSDIEYKSRDQGLDNLRQPETEAETESNRNLDQTSEEKATDEHLEISCVEAKEQSAAEFIEEQATVPTAEQLSDPPSVNNRLKVGAADESQDMNKLKLENSNINEEASTNEELRDRDCVEVEPGEEHSARKISQVEILNPVNVSGLSEQSEVMTANQVDKTSDTGYWSDTGYKSRDQGFDNLRQAETDSNRNLDQTSQEKVIDEHLEISCEKDKEHKAAELVVEDKNSPAAEQISDPPSVDNRLEVGTAEESQDKDKLMPEKSHTVEDSSNEEQKDGEYVEVEPGEEHTIGQTSDPPQIEVNKGFEIGTQAQQDKETFILENSNLEKEDSTILIGQIFPQVVARELYSEISKYEGEKSERISNSASKVNETEMLLKEGEPKMIGEKLEAIGAGTKTYQTITEQAFMSVQPGNEQSPISPSATNECGESINCQYTESRKEISRQEFKDSMEDIEVVKEECSTQEYQTTVKANASNNETQDADENLQSEYLHEFTESIQETQILTSEQNVSLATESLEEEMKKGTYLEAAEADSLNLVNVSGLSEQSEAMTPDQVHMGRINVDRLECDTTETVGKEYWSDTEYKSSDQGLANLLRPETEAEAESDRDLDQTSEARVTDEYLEISSEEAKEQRAAEFVLEHKIAPAAEQISEPPSIDTRLEVETAQESQDKDKLMPEKSNTVEDSSNEEQEDGEFVEVKPGEDLTEGETSDPPSLEVSKRSEIGTEMQQDKDTGILKNSNTEKEDSTILIGQNIPQVAEEVSSSVSDVNKTEILLKEGEHKMVEEKLEAIGSGTKTFQTTTNISSEQTSDKSILVTMSHPNCPEKEISYNSSEKMSKQKEKPELEMDEGFGTIEITDSTKSSEKFDEAAGNIELQNNRDTIHIFNTSVEKETNGSNIEKIGEPIEEKLMHQSAEVCEETQAAVVTDINTPRSCAEQLIHQTGEVCEEKRASGAADSNTLQSSADNEKPYNASAQPSFKTSADDYGLLDTQSLTDPPSAKNEKCMEDGKEETSKDEDNLKPEKSTAESDDLNVLMDKSMPFTWSSDLDPEKISYSLSKPVSEAQRSEMIMEREETKTQEENIEAALRYQKNVVEMTTDAPSQEITDKPATDDVSWIDQPEEEFSISVNQDTLEHEENPEVKTDESFDKREGNQSIKVPEGAQNEDSNENIKEITRAVVVTEQHNEDTPAGKQGSERLEEPGKINTKGNKNFKHENINIDLQEEAEEPNSECNMTEIKTPIEEVAICDAVISNYNEDRNDDQAEAESSVKHTNTNILSTIDDLVAQESTQIVHHTDGVGEANQEIANADTNTLQRSADDEKPDHAPIQSCSRTLVNDYTNKPDTLQFTDPPLEIYKKSTEVETTYAPGNENSLVSNKDKQMLRNSNAETDDPAILTGNVASQVWLEEGYEETPKLEMEKSNEVMKSTSTILGSRLVSEGEETKTMNKHLEAMRAEIKNVDTITEMSSEQIPSKSVLVDVPQLNLPEEEINQSSCEEKLKQEQYHEVKPNSEFDTTEANLSEGSEEADTNKNIEEPIQAIEQQYQNFPSEKTIANNFQEEEMVEKNIDRANTEIDIQQHPEILDSGYSSTEAETPSEEIASSEIVCPRDDESTDKEKTKLDNSEVKNTKMNILNTFDTIIANESHERYSENKSEPAHGQLIQQTAEICKNNQEVALAPTNSVQIVDPQKSYYASTQSSSEASLDDYRNQPGTLHLAKNSEREEKEETQEQVKNSTRIIENKLVKETDRMTGNEERNPEQDEGIDASCAITREQTLAVADENEDSEARTSSSKQHIHQAQQYPTEVVQSDMQQPQTGEASSAPEAIGMEWVEEGKTSDGCHNVTEKSSQMNCGKISEFDLLQIPSTEPLPQAKHGELQELHANVLDTSMIQKEGTIDLSPVAGASNDIDSKDEPSSAETLPQAKHRELKNFHANILDTNRIQTEETINLSPVAGASNEIDGKDEPSSAKTLPQAKHRELQDFHVNVLDTNTIQKEGTIDLSPVASASNDVEGKDEPSSAETLPQAKHRELQEFHANVRETKMIQKEGIIDLSPVASASNDVEGKDEPSIDASVEEISKEAHETKIREIDNSGMEKPAEFMQQEPVGGKEDHHSSPYLKDVEIQGLSTEMVQEHGEVNIADVNDTDTTENEQVAASLSGQVEAGPEESEKADISNESTGEKKTDDETKEVALNAVPEATDGENYRKGEDNEAIKEKSRTKELSTYSKHNAVLPYVKGSNIEMAHNENPSGLEDTKSTSDNIQEQDEEAVEVFDEIPTRGTDSRSSSGAIDLEIRQQDSKKRIVPPEIDEMKPEYPSVSVDESEGYVCQERNFPESSPLANITPPIEIEEEREASTIQDNHGKNSDNKVAPNDLEDIHASHIVISQKLQDKASEELPAVEKEGLIENTGIDTSNNKNTTQVQEKSASIIEAERETQAKAAVPDLLGVSVKESSDTEKYSAGESPIMINIEDVRAIKTENLEDEEKTDKHKDNDKEEEGSAQTREDSGSDGTVIVEVVSRDAAEVKIPHKRHHNILSGVGSKVKHSIAKVKKAITGKSSSQTKPPSPK